MAMLRMVSQLLSLWRKAFLKSSLRRNIVENALFEMSHRVRLFRGPWVMGHHDDGLARFPVEPVHQPEHLLGRHPVQVPRRLVGHEDGGVGDNCPRDGDALLLAPGELGGAMVHPVGEVDDVQGKLDVTPPLRPGKTREEQGQLDVFEGGEDRDQVVELEDEAHVRGAPGGELGFA